ncbi:hypothetical protein BX666DRAFT_1885406 [Dichotomocladium elegans]|nr:hypothetical protein BX666DRAFT_1885406 [Dichotomocladium elegans]
MPSPYASTSSVQSHFLPADKVATSTISAIIETNPPDLNRRSKNDQSHILIPIITHEPPTVPNSPVDGSCSRAISLPNPGRKPSSMSSFTSTSPAFSAIPLTSMSEIHDTEGARMRGPVLCAKYMKWFSRQTSVSEDKQFHQLRLHQTRLRWREFDAVLWADRLELYVKTNFVLKTRRLAHVIYLNKNASRRINEVKLSLVSDVDFSWRLAFESCEGRTVQFLFSTRSIRRSQEWYMALFRHSTISPVIPALVDLYIPTLNNLHIRLPLSDADFKNGNKNIKIEHTKTMVLNLLECQDSKPPNWTKDNVRLCWRRRKQQLEWISDDDFLISPQLIEQTHTLELRFYPKPEFTEEHTPRPVMEGDLLLSTDFRGKKVSTKRPIYAMLEGHLMFLLDPFDAVRLPGDEDRNKPRLSLASFSGTKAFLHVQTKRGFRSVTRLFHPDDVGCTSTTSFAAYSECLRRARNIANAFAVIDFTRITRVRRTSEESGEDIIHGRSFELHFGKDLFTIWEAPTMHMMFEWIHWIHKLLHTLGRQQSRDAVPMIAGARLGFRIERQWRSVLHAGVLYVRYGYEAFKQCYCVLTPERKLVLYHTVRRKRFTGEPTVWTAYEHHRTIKLDFVYVYTDDAHQHEQTSDHQPPRMYEDGTIIFSADSNTKAGCAFVIWQTAERHILATLRERLSFFKIGHQLGRKGATWVLLARCQEERTAWMWALQQALDQTSFTPTKATTMPTVSS